MTVGGWVVRRSVSATRTAAHRRRQVSHRALAPPGGARFNAFGRYVWRWGSA